MTLKLYEIEYVERLEVENKRLTARADANADHAKLANENRAFAAAALKASQARVAKLEGALRYVSGRMEHPRCPRCADNQEIAKQALGGIDE